MPFPALLLFSTAMLHVKPQPVFADVWFEQRGPYRFLVDTGAQTSRIETKLAAELGLKAEYRVEVVSQNSTHIEPALHRKGMRAGRTALPETELVFDDVAEAKRLDGSVRGVLGMNALQGLNFTLLPREGRVDFEAARPEGETLPLQHIEERIGMAARMGRETLTLILDSGSNHIVLFRTPQAMAKTKHIAATLSTLDGARNVAATYWTEDMFFSPNMRVGMLPAAVVRARATQVDGLLPASVFQAIYVDQARDELVLVR